MLRLKPALGGVCSLANYSVAYEETQSNRVSGCRDFVCSLFTKAILFDFYSRGRTCCLVENAVLRLKVTYIFLFYFPITKTYLHNYDPLKPQFYIVKLEFTGVYINFLISAQKHRL